MSKYSKNAILCGEADWLCILCNEDFHSLAEIEGHIRWEGHRKKLKEVTYFPKFKNDLIRKFGSNYFCEVCNTILPTALKTNLHIKDQKHIDRKQNKNSSSSTSDVKRHNKAITISNIVVSELEWNGIVENQCILCDQDFDDAKFHMKTSGHLIKLISSKTECNGGDDYYRKIGVDIFYCFVCKEPYSTSNFDEHWTSKQHLDKKKKISSKNANESASSSASKPNFSEEFKNNMRKMFASNSSTNNNKNSSNSIASHLSDFQKANIDLNFEKSKALCKVCKFSPAFTVKAITEHIKMHEKAEMGSPGFLHHQDDVEDDYDHEDDDDDYETISDISYSSSEESEAQENEDEKENVCGNIDYGKRRAELAAFGKLHGIKLIAAGSKGYCTLCDSQISAHIKNFKQHVLGALHRTLLSFKNKKSEPAKKTDDDSEYSTKPLKHYLKNIFFVKQMDDFWINRKICIDKHSFVLLKFLENGGKYDQIKCFICDDVLHKDKDQLHGELPDHKRKLFSTKVVTSLKREFVREIKPKVFHCGYCNEVYHGWSTLTRHLRHPNHHHWKNQQKMVADMTDDMYSMYMPDTDTAETDIQWMEMMGNRLL